MDGLNIQEFAKQYRLRLNDKKLAERYRLSWAEDVVPGPYGEIADMGDRGLLRLRLLAVPRSAVMSKALLARRRRALEAGFAIKWKGDAETILYFDPSNQAQAALAIELVGARRRKVINLTPDKRQALADRLAVARAAKKAA
jgi:hypothetical protein